MSNSTFTTNAKSEIQKLARRFAHIYYDHDLYHNIDNFVSAADIDKALNKFMSTIIDRKQIRQTIRRALINDASQYDDRTVLNEEFEFHTKQRLFEHFEDIENPYDMYNDLQDIDKELIQRIIQVIKIHERIDYSPSDITNITLCLSSTDASTDASTDEQTLVIEFFDSEEFTFTITPTSNGYNVHCDRVDFKL